MIFKVPSGIGDVSWLYSKLCNLPYKFTLEVCGDQPRRTLPFTELLPKVQSSYYGDFSYWQTYVIDSKGLPMKTKILDLKPGEYFVSCNTPLENSWKLAQIYPDLPTTYHYELNNPHPPKDIPKNSFGVYVSKYENYRADWKFWDPDEWVEFIIKIQEELNATPVLFGAKFDTNLSHVVSARLMEKEIKHINLVGETHIGELISTLKELLYFFSYASGLGVLADVVKCPCMHFLPTPRLNGLKNTYANPDHIKNNFHMNISFCSVEKALEQFKKGKEYAKARYR